MQREYFTLSLQRSTRTPGLEVRQRFLSAYCSASLCRFPNFHPKVGRSLTQYTKSESESVTFWHIIFRDSREMTVCAVLRVEKTTLFAATKRYASENARFASSIRICCEKLLSERRKVFRQTTRHPAVCSSS